MLSPFTTCFLLSVETMFLSLAVHSRIYSTMVKISCAETSLKVQTFLLTVILILSLKNVQLSSIRVSFDLVNLIV